MPIDSEGNTLTKEAFEKLAKNQQGPIKADTDNDWVQWQLVDNGSPLTVPAPRRYFQFRIDFTNLSLDASRAVADLGFEFARPPVDRIVAESWTTADRDWQTDDFYVLRPHRQYYGAIGIHTL